MLTYRKPNVIVDSESLQIKAVLGWEYSGFYPEYFEGHFYTRPGPSVALGDEKDDSEKLLSFLLNQGGKDLFESSDVLENEKHNIDITPLATDSMKIGGFPRIAASSTSGF